MSNELNLRRGRMRAWRRKRDSERVMQIMARAVAEDGARLRDELRVSMASLASLVAARDGLLLLSPSSDVH